MKFDSMTKSLLNTIHISISYKKQLKWPVHMF